MIGMTAKQLRDCVQRDTLNDGLRLAMGNGVVLQYFPGVTPSLQEVYIEGRRLSSHGLWDLDYFFNCSDADVNSFFDAMGGIVHVLEILE